jgi:tRNA uridine 5-carbamoylmethylation protein Kti12
MYNSIYSRNEKLKKMEKTLIILRGLPGSGKTTVAEFLSKLTGFKNFAADDFFTDDNGNYNFDSSKLGIAHKTCQLNVENSMILNEPGVIVSNTNTTEKEVNEYLKLAKKHNYRTFSLIVENRHDGKNVHSVPRETLEKMSNRFNIRL